MSTVLTKKPSQGSRIGLRRGPFQVIQQEVHDLLSQLVGQEPDWLPGLRINPSVDISETDQTVEVRLDAPGMKSQDFEIQLNGNLLTVSGERREETEEKGRTFHRVERQIGRFSRAMTLPCSVNEQKVEAKYRDGVLTITLPKTEEAKSRRIEVRP